ncbi:NAD-dependent epimerase/dehydratase family protein [Deltaproteobacteria bacterium TL4]
MAVKNSTATKSAPKSTRKPGKTSTDDKTRTPKPKASGTSKTSTKAQSSSTTPKTTSTPTPSIKTAPAEPEKAQLKYCLITGGAGFLGSNLAKALLEKGCKVRLFDITPPHFSHKNLDYLSGDIRNQEDLDQACLGIDTVFHTAAVISLMGGSAVTEEYRKQAYDINVQGTKNVLSACHKHGVARLVYTSSNNVCFDGTPNPDMDSNTPYAQRIYDLYTETKIQVEPYILKANDPHGTLTCVIRPAGIYGPEKCYMLDRFVDELASGKLIANLGNPNAVHDNSYIENLVHGEILAAEHLLPGSPVGGKAYFIVDDEPQNYFEFFRPLIEGLGHQFPKYWIPMFVVMPVFQLWQQLHFRFGITPPMMTPKELDKVCVTHFANIKDAEHDFGYRPVKTVAEAMKQCLPYCRERYDKILEEEGRVERPKAGWWYAIIGGMLALALVAFNAEVGSWFQKAIPLLGAVPLGVWKVVFWLAVAVHIGESFYARKKTREAGMLTSGSWTLQTLLLGYPSTKLMLNAVRKHEKQQLSFSH